MNFGWSYWTKMASYKLKGLKWFLGKITRLNSNLKDENDLWAKLVSINCIFAIFKFVLIHNLSESPLIKSTLNYKLHPQTLPKIQFNFLISLSFNLVFLLSTLFNLVLLLALSNWTTKDSQMMHFCIEQSWKLLVQFWCRLMGGLN